MGCCSNTAYIKLPARDVERIQMRLGQRALSDAFQPEILKGLC